jgi:hypothetical protein
MKRILTIEEVGGALYVRLGKFLLKMKPHVNVDGLFRLNEVHNAIRATLYMPKGKQWKAVAPARWYRANRGNRRIDSFLDSIAVKGEPYPIKTIRCGLARGTYGTQAVVERYLQWINESPEFIMDGYIYIFYLKAESRCKIGFSRALARRQLTINSQIGVNVTRIYESQKLINAYETEQNAHMVVCRSFKRLKGEWFEVKEGDIDDVVKMVKSIVESIGVKDDN